MGSSGNPVVAGDLWLVANRWGAYPAVLVGTIHNGELEARANAPMPRSWNQAFDYQVLLAVSNKPLGPRKSTELQDFAWLASGQPAYLKDFPVLYLSTRLPAGSLGRNWAEALWAMGRAEGEALILPPPERRTITMLYPDGTPLARAEVDVSIFGSRENHCGVAVGVDLGIFATNGRGEISLTATNVPLAISRQFFSEAAGGPAGERYSVVPDLVTGRDRDITVRKLWTLRAYDYVLRLQMPDGKPIVGAHLAGCGNFDGCSTGCGPVPAPASNEAGAIRFRARDLREMRSLTLVGEQGRKRALTSSELRELMLVHRLRLIWYPG
jgi:hypothetical protein